ncbi:hypothetical protein PTQ19_07535 [Microbacterium esteraromaticum]|uniref:hypothetical protein n=1 Tax=Microbacterium esteraromaticum TaxID=57043 RepID=UPI002367DB0D|nr:hypothetical protein [Microbacterium esteraromaticum]WDH77403.1 hypothetical protein PTQ19_07535 [Microbacterium esteraromaticum]
MPEHRALSIGAIAVIVVFAIENVVRGYVLNLADIVEWWQYATPVFAAFLCLAVVLGLIVFRGTTPPERPVVPATRRTWMSFGPRAGLVGAGVALLALLATTIAAGLASSADERGRFIYLEIPVPNEQIDAIRPWFYGWAYGVPVIICLAALIAVAWATLQSNATRPFLRPETVGAEQTARVEVASGAVWIATAGMLLALAGAWRFIARAGSLSQLTVQGEGRSDSYEAVWRYAEFAVAAGWLAPVLEITAFALLIFVASRLRRTRALSRSVELTDRTLAPQDVR